MEQVAAAEARLQTALAYVDAYYAGQALALDDAQRDARPRGAGGRQGAPGHASPAAAARSWPSPARVGSAEDESGDMRQQQSAAAAGLQRWTGSTADELAEPRLRRRADAGPVRRRPPGGRRPAARHRGDAPGGSGHPAQPQAELDLRAVVRAATGSTGPRVVRGQHPAARWRLPSARTAKRRPSWRLVDKAEAELDEVRARRRRRIRGAGERCADACRSASSATGPAC